MLLVGTNQTVHTDVLKVVQLMFVFAFVFVLAIWLEYLLVLVLGLLGIVVGGRILCVNVSLIIS